MTKIMIVDDEAVITLRLQQRLTSMGYNVIGIAHTGEECVEKAKKLRPDLILMDIMIPENLNGISAAKIIKAELDIPVIFITAFSEDQIIERAKHAEPHGYIVKPIQDRELKAAIEVALYKKELERRLRESELRYRSMIDSMGDAICAVDKDLHILTVNPTLIQWNTDLGLETEVIGRSLLEIYPFLPRRIYKEYHQVFESGQTLITEENIRIVDQNYATETRKIPIFEKERVDRIITVVRDITPRKNMEKALKKAHGELEKRVKKRTKDLEIKTKSLEELNTALKVLLEKRQEDKSELENNVLINVKEMILPYMNKIRNTNLDDQQKALLSIVESNLEEIISPFSRQLSIKFLSLTPTEIQIANLIKHGETSKHIAKIFNISSRTVDTHRKNIRKKIGLEKKKANLRSHLLSLK